MRELYNYLHYIALYCIVAVIGCHGSSEKQLFISQKNSPLLAFVGISRIYRNIVKSGEMKHEMTLFHTMGPNKNVLFQIHLFVTIYMVLHEALQWNF